MICNQILVDQVRIAAALVDDLVEERLVLARLSRVVFEEAQLPFFARTVFDKRCDFCRQTD